MQVSFTLEAIDDLRSIGDFIASDNKKRARSFVADLRSACRSLSREAERYPLLDQWPGVRRMPVANYLIFYRIENEAVQVLRVIHSARDLTELSMPH